MHPLIVGGIRERLANRRLEPAIQLDFHLCRIRDGRNARLVEAYLEVTRATAAAISRAILFEA